MYGKFTYGRPKKTFPVYTTTYSRRNKKIWENPFGVPSSTRIIQDVYLAFKAHKIIYENEGRIVPGLANRAGHRYSREGTTGNWGGPRTKNYDILDEVWLEPNARNAWEKRKSFTKSKYLEPF